MISSYYISILIPIIFLFLSIAAFQTETKMVDEIIFMVNEIITNKIRLNETMKSNKR